MNKIYPIFSMPRFNKRGIIVKTLSVVVIYCIFSLSQSMSDLRSTSRRDTELVLLKPTLEDKICIPDDIPKKCTIYSPLFIGKVDEEGKRIYDVPLKALQSNWGNTLSIYWQVESIMTLDERNGVFGWI